MKSSESGFVAALLLAVATGSAGASGGSSSIALGECNTESQIGVPPVNCYIVAGQKVCPPPTESIGSNGGTCRLVKVITDGALSVGPTEACPNGNVVVPSGNGTIEYLVNGVTVIRQQFKGSDAGDLSTGDCGPE